MYQQGENQYILMKTNESEIMIEMRVYQTNTYIK
jgi:hypothetical protein